MLSVQKVESEIFVTTGFINTPKFNGLTETNFDARIERTTRILAGKCGKDTGLDISDKNREQNKTNSNYLIYVILIVIVTSVMMDHNIS